VSYFSAALDSLMREHNLTQAELSRNASVHQGQLSRYLSDEARPDRDGLARLCNVFKSDGPRLAVAFLRDELPEALADKVELREKRPSKAAKPATTDAFASASPALRKFLEDAARVCERRPEVLRALESVLDITDSR
jgi:transcriptional regulator with XRE-family HTH domain